MSLPPDELKECKYEEYKKQNFSIPILKTYDYSKTSEQGVADMVEIDELNSASLVYNLANRYKKK
jgi:hypothetical protein